MAHELETINGRTAFATARKPAWHQLGTVTTGCMTAAEVITTALLADWNVRKIFVAGHTPDGATIAAPDKAMTVRTNPVTGTTDYLGVVGRDYVPVQNEACAELLDLLVDASGAHYETAGSLRGGRRIFITLRLPDGIRDRRHRRLRPLPGGVHQPRRVHGATRGRHPRPRRLRQHPTPNRRWRSTRMSYSVTAPHRTAAA